MSEHMDIRISGTYLNAIKSVGSMCAAISSNPSKLISSSPPLDEHAFNQVVKSFAIFFWASLFPNVFAIESLLVTKSSLRKRISLSRH